MAKVFHYTSARSFLRESWEEKKLKNPSFSLRSWARVLDNMDHAHLHRLLSGKKKIAKKHISLFSQTLGLKGKEVEYFETLVDLDRAIGDEEKEVYQNRLQRLAPGRKIKILEVEAFKFVKDPLCTLLLEMTEFKDFRRDVSWIQQRINLKVSQSEISSAIERLLSLEILVEDDEGNLKKTNRHLSGVVDVVNRGVQEYHKNVSHLAAEFVGTQDVTQKEFNSHTINIEPEKMALAKELIRDFINDFIAKVESPPKTGSTSFQLNTQLFQLTKNSKGDKR